MSARASMTKFACDQCRFRKVKCSGGFPCGRCTQMSFDCAFSRDWQARAARGRRIALLNSKQEELRAPAEASLRQLNGVMELDMEPKDQHRPGFRSEYTFTDPHDRTSACSQEADRSFPVAANLSRASQAPYSFSHEVAHSEDGVRTNIPGTNGPQLEHATSGSQGVGSTRSQSCNDGHNWADARGHAHSLSSTSPSENYSTAIWPHVVREDDVLQWVDVFLERLYWTLPLVDRIELQGRLMRQEHHQDRNFAALVLSLCALALIQPIYQQECAALSIRERKAKEMLQVATSLTSSFDFGENVDFDGAVTSFFIFAVLFNLGLHKAARLRLREAVECAWMLGVHRPDSYENSDSSTKGRRLRLFLILSVTERAVALQRNHHISFTGQNMWKMENILQDVGSSTDTPASDFVIHDTRNASAMQGLLQLARLYDSIDEDIIPCWNRTCSPPDQMCNHFTTEKVKKVYHAIEDAMDVQQQTAGPSPPVGVDTMSSPAPQSTAASSVLNTFQYADCFTLQQWLLIRLWVSCITHDLLDERSEHAFLRTSFSIDIATLVIDRCESFGDAVLEVHGIGMIERLHDIAMGVVMALQLHDATADKDVREHTSGILHRYYNMLGRLRGGRHPFLAVLHEAHKSCNGSVS